MAKHDKHTPHEDRHAAGEERAFLFNFNKLSLNLPRIMRSAMSKKSSTSTLASPEEQERKEELDILHNTHVEIYHEPDLNTARNSDENPVNKVLYMFRSRNMGAKEFDDFARGIQTWVTMMEMEAMRRFHDVHVGPIVEACEEYILRAAESLMDLIAKAVMLARLKACKRAAREVALLALKAVEKMLEELDRVVPSEMLFTFRALENLNLELEPVY